MDAGTGVPPGADRAGPDRGIRLTTATTSDVRRVAADRRTVPTAFWIPVAEVDPTSVERAGACLSEEERAAAGAFHHEADRRSYVLAHGLLREVLGALHDVEPGSLGLGRWPCPACGEPHGRPRLTRPDAGTAFSLSHARGAVAVLTGPGEEAVGVDVEPPASASSAASVLTRMHPEEIAEVGSLPESERPAAFTRAWVRKEALLKAWGIGLARHTALDYTGDARPDLRPPGWRLGDLLLAGGHHHLGICVPKRVASVEVVQVRRLG